MLWEVEIRPAAGQVDREAARVLQESRSFGASSVREVHSGRSFLIQGPKDSSTVERAAGSLLADTVVEEFRVHSLGPGTNAPRVSSTTANGHQLLNVLFKPGVTDNVAASAQGALRELGIDAAAVSTCRKYWINADAADADLALLGRRVLANDAIEQVVRGELQMENLALGGTYHFQLRTVPLRDLNDEQLMELSRTGQLYLSLPEMRTIRDHFAKLGSDPTDIELETIAQTWSEHCSHKTLGGRIRYRDKWNSLPREIQFENMLKETIFAATRKIREELGPNDWCVSVFRDNAGIVKFDDKQCVCFKAETHNHPSALEPYGGANTGLGGVIRDPLGTGLGARPVCNTDVFCFAPPDTPNDELPPGVLHPRIVAKGVVSGVRDYGNRMGIPTVNGAIVFDPRYLGNPLVYCGNVAMIPADKCEKRMQPGDYIVAVGGRTGRDGIHGATFSSAELTHESETLSGGAVQIGNAITEKMLADVILEARDRGLYSAITDCGAGGFSSAVGEMGEETGAEVWLDRAPLKYSGLSYTEIWISEAQERMVLAVPQSNWETFHALCASEGVEATIIGQFTNTHRLVLKYGERVVADLSMEFLHDGRPPVIREAAFDPPSETEALTPAKLPSSAAAAKPAHSASGVKKSRYDDDLKQILGSLNVCSKEWVIRQYDHEVQAGSVIKPLVGAAGDGPSDAAVVRPDIRTPRGLVIACGINPRFGDFDPYWMAASAIDEAVRNCIAVGADPSRIALLDNFCWGNTEKPEILGSLVRAALACHDVAVAWKMPFISGKDSLNNDFSYVDASGRRVTVTIPPSLLISALGQMKDVSTAVSMDLKEPGNRIYLVGTTHKEMGGSHFALVNGLEGGIVPRINLDIAPRIFRGIHRAISDGHIRSCHDLSEGGLAVAAAEMAFAGELGVDLDLSTISLDETVLLFSESNSRFLVEVPESKSKVFESLLTGLPCHFLGRVTDDGHVRFRGSAGKLLVDSPGMELKQAWKKPLAWD